MERDVLRERAFAFTSLFVCNQTETRLRYNLGCTSADIRDTYLKAINASLDACIPLKFTSGLGGALAGRPIAIRYVDNRELKHRDN